MTYQVLMMCTGNICRSAMAQIMLAQKLEQAGISSDKVRVISAGVSNEEEGHSIDSRARSVLQEHGYAVPSHSAHRVTEAELVNSDLVLAMTSHHFSVLERLSQQYGIDIGEDADTELRMFRDFDPEILQQGSAYESEDQVFLGHRRDRDVPDPWYGNREDFEETFATVERCIPNIMQHIEAVI